MNYVTIIVLFLVLFMQILLFFKKNNNIELNKKITNLEFLLNKEKNSNNDLVERLGSFEGRINKEFGLLKLELTKSVNEDFDKISNKIEFKLTSINNEVNNRLDKNFEKSNRTFTSVIERLTKIDEAQKKIDSLSSDIVSLQNVLTDKKTRGTFGEVNLEYILNNAFGSNSGGVYKTQAKMSNGFICDALLFAPQPLGTVAIDSKFPLENYQRMTDKNKSKEEREYYEKIFVQDVKKHISDISKKYIIEGETSDEAIMFLPAEAIFAEINAYHPELLSYAINKKIWITGPTTLLSTLSIISMILKNIERDKFTKVIHTELSKLSVEFTRYKDRWERFAKDVKTVNSRIDEIQITSDKISKRFDLINQVEIKQLITDEEINENSSYM